MVKDARGDEMQRKNRRETGFPAVSTEGESALGVLGALAGLVQADLLAFDHAGVAGEETGLAQYAPEGFVVFEEGAGDAVADGAGLARGAAAGDGNGGAHLVQHLGGLKGLTHDHACGLATEELVQRAAIDRDAAITGSQEYPGSGGLAPPGTVILLLCHLIRIPFQRFQMSRGLGCCAWWGCSGPA